MKHFFRPSTFIIVGKVKAIENTHPNFCSQVLKWQLIAQQHVHWLQHRDKHIDERNYNTKIV